MDSYEYLERAKEIDASEKVELLRLEQKRNDMENLKANIASQNQRLASLYQSLDTLGQKDDPESSYEMDEIHDDIERTKRNIINLENELFMLESEHDTTMQVIEEEKRKILSQIEEALSAAAMDTNVMYSAQHGDYSGSSLFAAAEFQRKASRLQAAANILGHGNNLPIPAASKNGSIPVSGNQASSSIANNNKNDKKQSQLSLTNISKIVANTANVLSFIIKILPMLAAPLNNDLPHLTNAEKITVACSSVIMGEGTPDSDAENINDIRDKEFQKRLEDLKELGPHTKPKYADVPNPLNGDALYNTYKSVYENKAWFNKRNDSKTGNVYYDPINPPNLGFDNRGYIEMTLEPGMILDRYGSDYGTYSAPVGTPYSQRSCTPGTDMKGYSVFVVSKPIKVKTGYSAPWFGEPGGGVQIILPESVRQLKESGSLISLG